MYYGTAGSLTISYLDANSLQGWGNTVPTSGNNFIGSGVCFSILGYLSLGADCVLQAASALSLEAPSAAPGQSTARPRPLPPLHHSSLSPPSSATLAQCRPGPIRRSSAASVLYFYAIYFPHRFLMIRPDSTRQAKCCMLTLTARTPSLASTTRELWSTLVPALRRLPFEIAFISLPSRRLLNFYTHRAATRLHATPRQCR